MNMIRRVYTGSLASVSTKGEKGWKPTRDSSFLCLTRPRKSLREQFRTASWLLRPENRWYDGYLNQSTREADEKALAYALIQRLVSEPGPLQPSSPQAPYTPGTTTMLMLFAG